MTGDNNCSQQQINSGTINGDLHQKQTIHIPANINAQKREEIYEKTWNLLNQASCSETWSNDDKINQMFVSLEEIKRNCYLFSEKVKQYIDSLEFDLRKAQSLENHIDRWKLFSRYKQEIREIFPDDLNKIN